MAQVLRVITGKGAYRKVGLLHPSSSMTRSEQIIAGRAFELAGNQTDTLPQNRDHRPVEPQRRIANAFLFQPLKVVLQYGRYHLEQECRCQQGRDGR